MSGLPDRGPALPSPARTLCRQRARAQAALPHGFLSGLLSEIYGSKEPDKLLADFKKQARRLLDFDDGSQESLLDTVHAEVNQAASFFELDLADQKSIAEVLQIANAELSVLNLSYEQMNRACRKRPSSWRC